MIFGRVKPLDAILATAKKKSLHPTLGAFQLTLFGIGCVIGTGIFVLTAAGAQKAGPGLMLAFAIAGAICIVAALCYAEIAAMIPVAGSAYTYTYSVMGEMLAWTVGWALVLEYAVAAERCVGRLVRIFLGNVRELLGVELPVALTAGPLALGGAPGGFINLPAVVIALLVTWLLMIGHQRIRQSQRDPGRDQSHGAYRFHHPDAAPGGGGELQSVPPARRVRRLWFGTSAQWLRRRRSSSPTSASTRSRPRPRRPRTRSATCRSA
jgi:hypothetical protein